MGLVEVVVLSGEAYMKYIYIMYATTLWTNTGDALPLMLTKQGTEKEQKPFSGSKPACRGGCLSPRRSRAGAALNQLIISLFL